MTYIPNTPIDLEFLNQDSFLLDTYAFYVLRNDIDLSLVYGNNVFFELIACSIDEMTCRYGNRTGIFVDEEDLANACEFVEEGSHTSFEHQLHRRDGTSIWAYTTISHINVPNEGELYLCTSLDISKYKKDQLDFQSYQSLMDLIFTQSERDIFLLDTSTCHIHFLSAHLIFSRLQSKELDTYQSLQNMLLQKGFLLPDSAQTFQNAFEESLHQNKRVICELHMQLSEDLPSWVCMTLSSWNPGITEKTYLIGSLKDITAKKASSTHRIMESQFYHNLLTKKYAYGHINVTEDHILYTGGHWDHYNELADKLSYSELIHDSIDKLVYADDRTQCQEFMQCQNLIDAFENGIDQLSCEFRCLVGENKVIWMGIYIWIIQDPISKHILALLYLKNIDEEKKKDLFLSYKNELDEQTNIFNQKTTEASIKQHLDLTTGKEISAFLLLDIDNFKAINEEVGQGAGDRILSTLAVLLRKIVRKEDIIGRYKRDEFILLLKNITNQEQVDNFLHRLYQNVSQCTDPAFTISIGVTFVNSLSSYERIFRQADEALSIAKYNGKSRFFYYNSDDSTMLAEQDSSLPKHSDIDTLPNLEFAAKIEENEIMRHFNNFISSAGEMAYLVEPDNYSLICGNLAFYSCVGLSQIQCYGKKCYEILHGRSSPCPFCSRANWSSDKFYMWHNTNHFIKKEFIVKNKLVNWQGKEAMLALAIDISNNNTIIDSFKNDTTEKNYILDGIERMTKGKHLHDALDSALETVGNFFEADATCFWQPSPKNNILECRRSWHKHNCNFHIPTNEEAEIVSQWVLSRNWESPIAAESPEHMLCYSFDMHMIMKRHQIQNQKWLQIKNSEVEVGYLSVESSSINFHNTTFLESFSTFIANEIQKRSIMDRMLVSNNYDNLTGLLSRSSYENYLHSYNADNFDSIGTISVNMINLSGINSNYGFQMGDEYLRQLADGLRKFLHSHSIYRLNGDEFLVVVENMEYKVLNNLIKEIKDCFSKDYKFMVSIGFAWDNVEKNLAELVEKANDIMLVNKEHYYNSNYSLKDTDRHNRLQGLLNEIENGHFIVYFQPKYNFTLKKLTGAEALIRYYSEEKGIVPPVRFIDLLEKNNLIRYIDLFVLDQVCCYLQKWEKKGYELPTISVNFSRLTLLEDDLLYSVNQIVKKYNIDQKYIEIEITESLSDMGKSSIYQRLRELSNAGYSISLDDFGIKYTNLSILSDIDIDVLKLDKSLINELPCKATNQVILKNIITMCDELNIIVIAEGIELKSQEDILRKLGCKMGQGYLYGKPMPNDEFETLLTMF